MRKSLIATFTLISLVTTPSYSKMIIEKEEYSAQSMMQEYALVSFYQRFLNVTESYNENRTNLEKFASSFKDIKEQHKFYRWLTKTGIKKLPKAQVHDGVARIQFGENKIEYSILTLTQNHVLINGHKFSLEKLNFNQAFHKIKDKVSSSNKFTFLDLIISKAHADGNEGLENAMLATMLYINSDFSEREWCVSCSDENKEVTKKNFEKLLSKVDEKLTACENESAGIDEVYSNIGYFEGRDDEGGFRMTSAANLKNYFPEIERELKDVTCESLVFDIYKEEIFPKAKHAITRYAEGFTHGRNLAAHAKQKYENEVKAKCDRVAQLNACMLTNSYTAQDVYNNSRGTGEKEFNYRSKPRREYRVRGTSQ